MRLFISRQSSLDMLDLFINLSLVASSLYEIWYEMLLKLLGPLVIFIL